MKIGINTFLWTSSFGPEHFSLLAQFKQWGFDGVEVATFDMERFPAAEARTAAADAGLECTLCSALSGSLSLVSEDAAIRQKARDFLLRGIEVAGKLGSPVFAGPFCAPVGYLPGRRRTADEWKRAVDGLRSLTEALDAHNVSLAVEPLNRFETYFLNTAADTARLCAEVNHPRVGALLDTFHANIEEKNIRGAAEVLGSRIFHVHTCENDRGTPGSGHVDWDALFPALQRAGYDGWLVIESFAGTIPEIAAAACIWRDLARTPEAIAIDGAVFLRKMTQQTRSQAGN